MDRCASSRVLPGHMCSLVQQQLHTCGLPCVGGKVEWSATLAIHPVCPVLCLGKHDHQGVLVPVVGCQVERRGAGVSSQKSLPAPFQEMLDSSSIAGSSCIVETVASTGVNSRHKSFVGEKVLNSPAFSVRYGGEHEWGDPLAVLLLHLAATVHQGDEAIVTSSSLLFSTTACSTIMHWKAGLPVRLRYFGWFGFWFLIINHNTFAVSAPLESRKSVSSTLPQCAAMWRQDLPS